MYYGIYSRLGVTIYASNMTVLRALRKRLHPASRRGREGREHRHLLYRAILKEHENALSLPVAWRL